MFDYLDYDHLLADSEIPVSSFEKPDGNLTFIFSTWFKFKERNPLVDGNSQAILTVSNSSFEIIEINLVFVTGTTYVIQFMTY